MTRTLDQFSKVAVGPGQAVEDANPVPIIFRAQPDPLIGGGTPQPRTPGQSPVTGNPFAEKHPLPL